MEEKVEAERLLLALQSALQEDGDKLLSAEEQESLQHALHELKEVMLGDNLIAIRAALKALNALSEPYAARRMNAGVQQALSGKMLDEIG
jgi:molecular chaperone HscA